MKKEMAMIFDESQNKKYRKNTQKNTKRIIRLFGKMRH